MTTDKEYKGIITRIVDGDTLIVELPFPEFSFSYHARIRLQGVYAPELNTLEGKKRKSDLEKYVGKDCITRLVKHDKYGRIVARVWVETPKGIILLPPPITINDLKL